jgi:hypothetical protein
MITAPKLLPPTLVTAEAQGTDAIAFTFPDGNTFVRDQIGTILGWAAISSQEDGVARTRVELHCRDEHAFWITMIIQDAKGRFEEMIVLPRMPLGTNKQPVQHRNLHAFRSTTSAPRTGVAMGHGSGMLAAVHSGS